ncbi:MAG: lipase family protein, partial [Myxococcota bacterium]
MTTPNLVDRILSLSSKEKLGHPDVTYLLSLISAWSYSDDATLLKILRRDSLAGKQRALHIEHHSVQNSAFPVDVNAVLVSIGEGEVETPLQVLAFRGTEVTNFIDLLTDALVEPHPWPRGGADEWVHRGFFLSLDVLWPELSEELSRKQGYLVFTGHSLGGALAVLAGRRSCDDELQGPELGGVYTFGQPMVGGEAFVRAWPDLPLHRFVFH